jgi:hypothetical protein
LEKLVIHKGKFCKLLILDEFKGDESYYRSRQTISATELKTLLEEEDSQVGNKGRQFTEAIPSPESLLTDEELEAILDRSPEAFLTTSASSERFKVIEDADDEANNALAGMKE